MHAKRVYLWSIGWSKTRTTQAAGWIFLQRPIAISEIKGTSECTDAVVIGLLVPVLRVSDGDEAGVADVVKDEPANMWAPGAIQYLSIPV